MIHGATQLSAASIGAEVYQSHDQNRAHVEGSRMKAAAIPKCLAPLSHQLGNC